MLLTFTKQHKSILSFPSTEITSDFVVITGINGAGKSHLLEAIENGSVTVDGIPSGNPHVRRFHHTSMEPKETGAANPTNLWTQREGLWNEIGPRIEECQTRIRSNLLSHGIPSEHLVDLEAVSRWSLHHLEVILNDSTKATQVHPQIKKLFTQENDKLWNKWGRNSNRASLAGAIRKKCDFAITLSEDVFEKHIPLDWNPTDVFQQNFAPLFANYHRHREVNKINRYYATQEGDDKPWLDNEQFSERYGQPPWEVVNEVLTAARLPLRVNRPTGQFDQPFSLKLHHNELDCDVQYGNLSSGEKIIISLAHCLYYAQSGNTSLTLPKLLLLDEPDAPLHPAMAKSFMDVVEQVLVRDHGVKVIMTTHSPSTIAFAPPQSVFRLARSPRQLLPSSQEAAISDLTDGFSTVMPKTRFVIVEAGFDQDAYQSLFKSIHQGDSWPGLSPLVFVRASDQDNRMGGGCSQVSQWAEKLSSSGLKFFRGVIDRDSGNTPTDVVHVLGRYSIENYLLDPIVLYACLVERNLHAEILEIEELRDCNVHSIAELPNEKLQQIADATCSYVEAKRPQFANAEKFTVNYRNDKTITASAWIRDTRGHDLSLIIRECFRADNVYSISKNLEELLLMMTTKLPEFIPKDLEELFIALAK